jgi:hypothetical protein
MKPCTQFETLLTEKLFGELDASREHELNEHLQSCAACRATLAELQHVIQALGKPAPPQMPEHFWTGYWDRLRERMASESRPQSSWRESIRARFNLSWSPAFRLAAATALVLLGIFIGRFLQPQARQNVATQTAQPHETEQAAAISQRTANVLDRSKILLLGVVNEDFSAASAEDVVRRRKVSRELLTEVRSLQTVLPGSPDRRLMQLVQQLELVLMQIAALEAEHDLTNVEMVREGIDREGLLLKINIEELKRKAQSEKAPPSKPYL